MNALLKTALAAAGLACALPLVAQEPTRAVAEYDAAATPQVTFYEHAGFGGQSYTTGQAITSFAKDGFNDSASSIVVMHHRWEACEGADYAGRCVVLRPGRYPSLAAMGLNDRITSVRVIAHSDSIQDQRYAPAPIPVYDNRQRNNEQLYPAKVTAVRAVVGTPEQRCWVGTDQVAQDRGNTNADGVVYGASVGAVLGHQIGDGHGQDLATAVGALAGASVGATMGPDGTGTRIFTRDVQRCTSIASQARADYWDVTYVFAGKEHRMQSIAQPGQTVLVNDQGEPRA